MEKKIIITMSVDEAREFERYIENVGYGLDKWEESLNILPDSGAKNMRLLAMNEYRNNLEKLMEVFKLG